MNVTVESGDGGSLMCELLSLSLICFSFPSFLLVVFKLKRVCVLCVINEVMAVEGE